MSFDVTSHSHTRQLRVRRLTLLHMMTTYGRPLNRPQSHESQLTADGALSGIHEVPKEFPPRGHLQQQPHDHTARNATVYQHPCTSCTALRPVGVLCCPAGRKKSVCVTCGEG